MTIAMLSWNSHKTLINTLASYHRNNLEDTQKIIFFQEKSDEDRAIAGDYGWEAIGTNTNIGIGPAMRVLGGYASGEYFFFLENDWEALRDTRLQLSIAKSLLDNDVANVVRFRDRTNHGWPLWSKQFENREMERPEHLLDSVHWRENPDLDFPEQIQKLTAYVQGPKTEKDTPVDFYSTSSFYANFTNNPTMYKTKFFQDTICPHLDAPGRASETDIQPWWREQKFKVVQGPGLFTHNRID